MSQCERNPDCNGGMFNVIDPYLSKEWRTNRIIPLLHLDTDYNAHLLDSKRTQSSSYILWFVVVVLIVLPVCVLVSVCVASLFFMTLFYFEKCRQNPPKASLIHPSHTKQNEGYMRRACKCDTSEMLHGSKGQFLIFHYTELVTICMLCYYIRTS